MLYESVKSKEVIKELIQVKINTYYEKKLCHGDIQDLIAC